MANVNAYLNFDKLQCEAAFNHYKSVLGGEITELNRFKEAPPGMPMAPGEEEGVLHMALKINDHSVLMGSDCPQAMGTVNYGNSITLSAHPESEDEAKQIFEGLAAGGKVGMPLEKTFWGALFGTCVDKFGINWMVNYQLPR